MEVLRICKKMSVIIRWHRCPVGGTRDSRGFKYSSHALMPSLCGMLVSSEETLRVTRMLSGGSTGNLCILLMKSVVSRICEGSWVTLGCKKKSTKCEMFPVGSPLEDTRGLPGLPGL